MGIFDLFRRDASQEWLEQGEQPLALDLRELSLNGIPLGAPGTDLSQFGRPSNSKPFKNGRFLYERLGLVIELKNERVEYFGFPFRKSHGDPVGPCEVSVVFPDGAEVRVTDKTVVETLLPHLPAPAETDSDEEETIYFFAVQGHQLEIEVSPQGRVCRLNLFHE